MKIYLLQRMFKSNLEGTVTWVYASENSETEGFCKTEPILIIRVWVDPYIVLLSFHVYSRVKNI